ncbi:MAG TPA: hypothetical protein VN363_00595 [Anaerolineales bacterium]|nr:hypothetical protein [Anaerolineales bacterium]
MSNPAQSFAQALELLVRIRSESPYRRIRITCRDQFLFQQLLDAWQKHYRVVMLNFTTLFPELDGQDLPAYQSQMIPHLNRLAESKDHLVIVLENNVQSGDQVVQSLLIWLVDYLPANITLVCRCSDTAPLPLGRLRVRRQLLEISLDG